MYKKISKRNKSLTKARGFVSAWSLQMMGRICSGRSILAPGGHWEKWVLLGGEGKGRILVAVLASQQDITMISPGEI